MQDVSIREDDVKYALVYIPYQMIATLRVGTRFLTEWWKFSVTGSQKSVKSIDESWSFVRVVTSACRILSRPIPR